MSVARRSQGWLYRALTCGALLAGAALALPAPVAHADPSPSAGEQASDSGFLHDLPPDQPAPPLGLSQQELRSLLKRLQNLHRQAEEATEQYKGAKEKRDRQRQVVKDLTRELDDQREEVRENRAEAGRLARKQYRQSGLSDYGILLLSDDPQEAFDRSHDLNRAAEAQAEVVRRLQDTQKNLDKVVTKQRAALKKAERYAEDQRKARDRVEDRVAKVEDIVSTLTGVQLEELRRLEEDGFDAAQAEFLASGALGQGNRAASDGGQTAVAWAFKQLGDPYVWGAEGPDAFDCSGLTSQAWAAAGTPIPRTSQEQWKQLPRIPLNLLRPGDLVIYYPGATHVGMYIGNGKIVHAPRTGDVVKVAPVGGMPILGAVRPDPGASAGDGKVPVVPER